MDLPGDSVGPSDIIAYRECAQRFAFGMRRHSTLPDRFSIFEGESAEAPDSESYPTAYGSCVHDAIRVVEETQCTDEEAIDRVWPDYQAWLEPDDGDRLKRDLETYRTRTVLGYRLIGAELEMRVPLFTHEGRIIYLRGRVDVLYQHMQNPGVFLSRDYKSGRVKKGEPEIHRDIQQWLYNLLIHEFFPECVTLTQMYDQLRYGETPTYKSAQQRRQIREFAIHQVKAILADQTLKPKQNQWCQHCPLVMDCRVTHLSADYWKNRLAVLAPEKKVGRKIVVQLTEDAMGFDIYMDLLPRIKSSAKAMERFVKEVEAVLRLMPQSQREAYGYALGKPRETDRWGPSELRQVHALLGDDFYHLIGLTKASLERMYGKDSDRMAVIQGLAFKEEGNPTLMAPKVQ